MSVKKFAYTSLVSHLIIGFFSVSHAQTAPQENVKVLETVRATGQAEEKAVNDVTQTKKELDRAGVKNWGDYGKRLDPSVDFNQSKRTISIRGQTGTRIEVTEDGIPLPYVEEFMLDRLVKGGNGGHQAINFESVSSVNVAKGPGSGNASIAGAVNVQSLRPRDLLLDKKSYGVRLKEEYSGLDDSWTSTAAMAFRLSERLSALLSYTYKTGHEVKNYATEGGLGSARLKSDPMDVNSHHGLFRLEYQINPAHSLDFGASTFDEKSTIFRLFEMGPTALYSDSHSKQHAKRDRLWLTYQYMNPESFTGFDAASAQVYWSSFKTKARNFFTYNASGRTVTQGLGLGQEGYGLNTKLSGTFGDSQFSSRWQLGARFSHSTLMQDLYASDGKTRPLIPNADSQDMSVSLSNTFSWHDGLVELTPGLRHDRFKRSPSGFLGKEAAQSASGSAWSPSIELRVRPTQELSLYGRWAKGFRAPSVSELYYSYGFQAGPGFTYDMRGNPLLKPEVSQGYELGVQWKSDTLDASLNYFEQTYQNHIAGVARLVNLGGGSRQRVVEFLNYEKARIRGIEGMARWAFQPNWYVRAGFTYSEGKNLRTNKPLSSAVPFKGIVGIGYDTGNMGIDIGVNAARANNRVDTERYFKQPGYGVVDLTAYWQPESVKGLRVQVNVFNALNKKYWNAGAQVPFVNDRVVDYYTQRGRHVAASVQYQF